jgi:hypothetical protein
MLTPRQRTCQEIPTREDIGEGSDGVIQGGFA